MFFIWRHGPIPLWPSGLFWIKAAGACVGTTLLTKSARLLVPISMQMPCRRQLSAPACRQSQAKHSAPYLATPPLQGDVYVLSKTII